MFIVCFTGGVPPNLGRSVLECFSELHFEQLGFELSRLDYAVAQCATRHGALLSEQSYSVLVECLVEFVSCF